MQPAFLAYFKTASVSNLRFKPPAFQTSGF